MLTVERIPERSHVGIGLSGQTRQVLGYTRPWVRNLVLVRDLKHLVAKVKDVHHPEDNEASQEKTTCHPEKGEGAVNYGHFEVASGESDAGQDHYRESSEEQN